MKAYNVYIMVVAVLLLATTVVLAAMDVSHLGNYVTLYVIEALVATELFTYFNRRARRALTVVSVVLFGSFVVAMAGRIMAVVG